MGQSIRAFRVQQLLELIGSSREVSFEVRRPHLAEGVRQLLGASAAILVRVEEYRPDRRPSVTTFGASGFAEPRRSAYLDAVLASSYADPIVALGARAGAQATHRRRDLLSDRDWYRTPWVCDTLRPADLDDGVYAIHRFEGRSASETMGVFRRPGDRPFTEEDRELVRLVNLEAPRLLRSPPPSMLAEAMRALPPRQAQTLERLCAGASEKQIAQALGISANTVHDYVKALYRAFDVVSRGELLARFIGTSAEPRRPRPASRRRPWTRH